MGWGRTSSAIALPVVFLVIALPIFVIVAIVAVVIVAVVAVLVVVVVVMWLWVWLVDAWELLWCVLGHMVWAEQLWYFILHIWSFNVFR